MSARHQHVARSLAGLAVVLGTVFIALGASPASAADPATTQVSFAFLPAGTVTVLSLENFHATVTPSGANGVVYFKAGPTTIASQSVSKGEVSLSTTLLPQGLLSLTAVFVPTDAAAYAPSTSPAQQLLVLPQSRVALSTSDGTQLAAGGPIKPGTAVTVTVSGFPADQLVTVTVTPGLAGSISTDGSGGGSTILTIPLTMKSASYQVTAASGNLSTAFGFYVYNPAVAAAATPAVVAAPTVSSTPPPATVPIVTVVGTGGTTTTTTTTTTTVPATGIPASGATPALAHTGGDVLDLGPLAVLLVLAGAGLVRLGAADSATRRQVLEPSVGRHLAISGRHLRP